MYCFSSGTGVCLGHCIIFCLSWKPPRYGGRHALETELVYRLPNPLYKVAHKNETAYFAQYVDTITGISVWHVWVTSLEKKMISSSRSAILVH